MKSRREFIINQPGYFIEFRDKIIFNHIQGISKIKKIQSSHIQWCFLLKSQLLNHQAQHSRIKL